MLFKKYGRCIYCNSSNLKKEKTQYSKYNFYTDAIENDLEISKKKLKQTHISSCKTHIKSYKTHIKIL